MADTETVDALISENWRLAESMARKFVRYSGSNMHVDDLRSSAMLALWQAAKRWEPQSGHPFAAFAVRCIRFALINEIRRVMRGRSGHKDRIKMLSFEAAQKHNDTTRGGSRDANHLTKFLEDTTILQPEDAAVTVDTAEKILAHLKGRNGDICRKHWLDGRTLLSLGIEYGVTEGRICQIVKSEQKHMRWVVNRIDLAFQ